MGQGVEVSYIVSLYHRPDYLAVCLYCLRGQTHQDFEVIVTDNSEDPKFVREHRNIVTGMNEPRFRYVRTFGKIEVPDCYWSAEYGMKLAKGKWLCFPCEDCYYPPEWTQRMLIAALQAGWDLVLCGHSISGPETCGIDRYAALELGSLAFPGYKPSFLARGSRFRGWKNKPTVSACSGTDRTTLQQMVRDPEVRWGVARDLFYVHN